jgi:hypothetical protein
MQANLAKETRECQEELQKNTADREALEAERARLTQEREKLEADRMRLAEVGCRLSRATAADFVFFVFFFVRRPAR